MKEEEKREKKLLKHLTNSFRDGVGHLFRGVPGMSHRA